MAFTRNSLAKLLNLAVNEIATAAPTFDAHNADDEQLAVAGALLGAASTVNRGLQSAAKAARKAAPVKAAPVKAAPVKAAPAPKATARKARKAPAKTP